MLLTYLPFIKEFNALMHYKGLTIRKSETYLSAYTVHRQCIECIHENTGVPALFQHFQSMHSKVHEKSHVCTAYALVKLMYIKTLT